MHHYAPRCSSTVGLIASLTLLLLTVVFPSPTAGQLGCATTCTGTVGSGMTCNVRAISAYSATCGAPPAVGEFINGAPLNAACNLGAVDGMASVVHTSMQPTPASCSVRFVAFLAIGPVGCTHAFTTGVDCLVNDGDGLPVELMSFEIDGGSDVAPQGKPGDPDNQHDT